ncbi:MAG: UDP-4-amino-4,6-dideoxy-N-acetyl-beta-L-altrosamine transaminase [Candidatus Binatia bacterium]
MRTNSIPLRAAPLGYGHQCIDEDDIKAVVAALRDDFITQGPRLEEFERAVANYCNARYGVAFSSGTAALHAACAAAGLGPGNEAITSPLTFVATANAVVYCGARPVFADIEADTLTIDPVEIRRRLTDRTKVLLPVDFAGLPANLDKIREIAAQRNLVVIEDAAHSLGSKYYGRKVGSLSDMTVLSFHPVKAITTGEGGMVLTDDERFYERLRTLRHHGILRDRTRLLRDDGPWYYEIHELGHNFRVTDFQCALGLSQLGKLDNFLERRRKIAARYTQVFREFPEIILQAEPPAYTSAYHLYVLQLEDKMIDCSRREVYDALWSERVRVGVHYIPVHHQPFYQQRFGCRPGDYPKTERYYSRAITLPLYPAMTDGEVEYVIEAVRRVISRGRRQ